MSVAFLHADARELWPVADESAAAVVTSPPYNAGIAYDDDPTGDQMPWDEYQAMANAVMANAARVLIDGGRAWINVTPSVPVVARGPGWHSGQTTAERVSLIDIWSQAAALAGLNYRDTVCWGTPGRGPGTAWGSYASPAGPNMRGEWEAILAFSKGTWARQTPDRWKGWKDQEGGWTRLVSNLWTIQPEGDRTHPAPFPLELPSRCIRLSTWPDELVVDPFAGSGTTLLAARGLGRHAIGLDRSATYVEMGNARLAQGDLFAAS